MRPFYMATSTDHLMVTTFYDGCIAKIKLHNGSTVFKHKGLLSLTYLTPFNSNINSFTISLKTKKTQIKKENQSVFYCVL